MTTFEELRQALERLNHLRARAQLTDDFRDLRTENADLMAEQGATERGLVHLVNALNPERITWEDVNREVAALEEQIVLETGFGVTYWTRSVDGVEIDRGYVLVPKNEGWLEAKRRQAEE